MRILALGDSYTIGEGVTEKESWPMQLAAALISEGFVIETPLVIARTGWTTNELLQGISAANPRSPFDLVTLLIGVNNQYRGLSLEEYRAEFKLLLNHAVDFAGGDARRVLVLSIPDWSVTPFAAGRLRSDIAGEIEQFNQVELKEAQSANVRYVNITPISRQAEGDPGLLAPDGMHPSGAMYAAWVELAMPVALEMIQ